jgi:hypothetical protein
MLCGMSTPAIPLLFHGGREFSLAELSSARLDGEVTPVGDAFAPLGVPVDVRHRVAALAADVPPGCSIVGRSAAWAHGAVGRCPLPVEVGGAGPSARWERPYRSVRTMRIRHDHLQLVPVGAVGVGVLTPVAAVIDLARIGRSPADDALMVSVIRRCALTRDVLLTAIGEWSRLPGKRRALERIEAALVSARQPPLTRYTS